MVPQLGFHIITVLHSSSAQIGILLVVTYCYLSRKVEAVIQTTIASSSSACPLSNIIALKVGFLSTIQACGYFDESIANWVLERLTLL